MLQVSLRIYSLGIKIRQFMSAHALKTPELTAGTLQQQGQSDRFNIGTRRCWGKNVGNGKNLLGMGAARSIGEVGLWDTGVN